MVKAIALHRCRTRKIDFVKERALQDYKCVWFVYENTNNDIIDRLTGNITLMSLAPPSYTHLYPSTRVA